MIRDYFVAACAILALTMPFQAYAVDNGFFFKPNVGADYQYNNVNYDNGFDVLADDTLHGANVHIGARVHKYLGFEAGYLWTADADKTFPSSAKSTVNLEGFNFDALGYLPIDDAGRFELIGTAGITHLKAKFSVPAVPFTASDSETKFRAGGGAQFWITPNLNVRGLVRYQDANFSNTVKHIVEANAGLNWQF